MQLESAGSEGLAPDGGRSAPRALAREALQLLRRPQPVTPPMVMLFSLIPFYLVIGELVGGGPLHRPELALDRWLPILPGWSLVYGSLLLAAVLPVFVVHQKELVHRTVMAFLVAWLTAFVVFIAYPTMTPRPGRFEAEGFLAAALRLIWDSDVDTNCFPSLHVAQCFLAAFACGRVHRGVGAFALAWATLVALSTLFTKQHYVVDVAGGLAMGVLLHLFLLRPFERERVPLRERRLAPFLAACAFGAYGAVIGALWIAYVVMA